MDTGGAFRQITTLFWTEAELIYFLNGLIDNSNDCQFLGKLLFWTMLHNGYWPQWLNKMHIQYIFEDPIVSTKLLKQHNKPLYSLYNQIVSNGMNWRKGFENWVENRDIVSIYIKNFF
jgi:hypothetical protein